MIIHTCIYFDEILLTDAQLSKLQANCADVL